MQIDLRDLHHSEGIFNRLSKGKFLSNNSNDRTLQDYFNELFDNQEFYDQLFKCIGFELQQGVDYFYLSRKNGPNQAANYANKADALCAWLLRLDLLKSYDSSIGPGYRFNQVDFQSCCQALDLSRKIKKVYSGCSCINEMADKLMMDLEDIGFAEREITSEKIYRITPAFNYIERLLDSVEVCKEDLEELPEENVI